MKFDYKLYRPKKIMKDMYGAVSSYYKAPDVHVSPLTKIGDVAEMPDSERATRHRKPVFSKHFNRNLLTFGPRKKADGRPAIISVHTLSDQEQRVSVRTHKSRNYKPSWLYWPKRFQPILYVLPVALLLAVGSLGMGLHVTHSLAVKAAAQKSPDSVDNANHAEDMAAKPKKKAKSQPAQPAPAPVPAQTPLSQASDSFSDDTEESLVGTDATGTIPETPAAAPTSDGAASTPPPAAPPAAALPTTPPTTTQPVPSPDPAPAPTDPELDPLAPAPSTGDVTAPTE